MTQKTALTFALSALLSVCLLGCGAPKPPMPSGERIAINPPETAEKPVSAPNPQEDK